MLPLLTALLMASQTEGKVPDKPNIVFILADDMGYQDVGFRDSDILTPHIDQLAKDGVILENHYVMPQCSPTRASLLSGRYAIRTGFWKGNIKPNEEWGLRLNETTLAEMLKRNGYSTHGIGKWHAGMYTWDHTPAKRGFDTYFGLYLGSHDYYTHKRSGNVDLRDDYFDQDGKFVDDVRLDLQGNYSTYLYTDRAVKRIEEHDTSKPLFLYLSYTSPHAPTQAPQQEINRFSSHMVNSGKSRKTYATQISIMDEGIGKVVATLKQRNMLDNTIVVFTADNGAVFGKKGSNYPLRGGKKTLFEGGVRAVSFVHSPLLQKTGYINTNLHHITDWYATFQRLSGDEPQKHTKQQLPIDGVDIWDSISGDKPCREEVLMNYRDKTMIQESEEHEFRRRRRHVSDEVRIDSDDEFDDDAGDFFVIRWKDWKLFTGLHYKVPGWTTENNLSGKSLKESRGGEIGSGTILFNLADDPREERDVAAEYPDVVKTILAKMPEYKEKMTKVNKRSQSTAGAQGGIWKPWVKNV